MDPEMFYFQKAAEQITLQMQQAADANAGDAKTRLHKVILRFNIWSTRYIVCLLTLNFKKLKISLYLKN